MGLHDWLVKAWRPVTDVSFKRNTEQRESSPINCLNSHSNLCNVCQIHKIWMWSLGVKTDHFSTDTFTSLVKPAWLCDSSHFVSLDNWKKTKCEYIGQSAWPGYFFAGGETDCHRKVWEGLCQGDYDAFALYLECMWGFSKCCQNDSILLNGTFFICTLLLRNMICFSTGLFPPYIIRIWRN